MTNRAPSTAAPTSSAGRHLSLTTRETIWGYIFIAPWLLGLLVLSLGPFAAAIYFSFTEYSVLEAPVWVGLKNYQKLFTADPLFGTSLANTLYYVGVSVPLLISLGFALALLLNQPAGGIGAYRAAYYLPTIVPAVANAVIWVWLFNPQLGPFRFVFNLFGAPAPLWIQSEEWSKPALIVVSVWGVGTMMMVFLAGLQGIPDQLYEAAQIDGAGPWHRLRHVTIPLMTPTIFFNLVMGIINSFQVFAYAFIMTKGGPLNSSLVYVLYIFRNAFEYFQMGYASALAVVLFLIVLVLTLLVFWSGRHWVHYEFR